MTKPTEHYIAVNGTRLCYFEWGQPTPWQGVGTETILLLHATGFHARVWDQVISHLGDRHVLALELRGHGRSDDTGPITWDTFGEDVTAFVQAMDLNHLVAAGHSMGGCSLVMAMANMPLRFDRAVLIDPVIMAPEMYEMDSPHHRFLDGADSHPVARRKNAFLNADAMFNNLHGRGSYATWLDQCLRDYCEFGLLPDPVHPGFVLACPPNIEASIYMGSSSHSIHTLLTQVLATVTVLRAERKDPDNIQMDFTKSPTWPELANHLPKGRDVYLPELTHFMPMQNPKLVAGFVLDEQ